MKNIIIAALVTITLFSCTREAKQSNKSEVNKGKKAEALIEVADLVLTFDGSTFTTTISPNAEWGGVQKFVTMSTVEGAVSVCNWNWSGVQAPASKTCSSLGSGFYRSWTSDKVTYDVHLSNWITIP